MVQNQDLEIILSKIESPAFFVQCDSVYAVNSAAAQYDITVNQDVNKLIAIGMDEYTSFQNGNLYLTVCSNGIMFNCSVSKLQDGNLFVMEEKSGHADLQLLSLAAKQLSFPLTELSILFDRASGMDNNEKERINKILFQLHRITNNMSDAIHLQSNPHNLQRIEICSVFEEILEKAKVLFEDTPVEITYKLPKTPIYAAASGAFLERAVYNMLSNAAKYGTNKINATLTQIDGKAYFSVTNGNSAGKLQNGIFTRYKRAPGIESPRYGLGLGMTLIHAIAKAHGGTVLVEMPTKKDIKITMSISLKPQKNKIVRSPIIKPDIYGGRDTALVELSDILPSHLYGDS